MTEFSTALLSSHGTPHTIVSFEEVINQPSNAALKMTPGFPSTGAQHAVSSQRPAKEFQG
jgi:hypothetical protein